MKLKAKSTFRAVAIFLFYIVGGNVIFAEGLSPST
jgi:hypothetical protein